MNTVLCTVVLKVVLNGFPGVWSGQIIGLEYADKAKGDRIFVDFTVAIKETHQTLVEGQPSAYYIRENDCLYVNTPVTGAEDTTIATVR